MAIRNKKFGKPLRKYKGSYKIKPELEHGGKFKGTYAVTAGKKAIHRNLSLQDAEKKLLSISN